ncbi:MAG: GNAT family N-acetyltransferase [Parasphingorhabdus sp.]
MDLSGVQKLEGSDIKRRDRRGSPADRKPVSELRSTSKITPNLRAAWKDLVANASEPNIFHEPWFLEPGLKYFCTDPGQRIFLLWAGEPNHSQLLGLLPLGPTNRFGRWPVPHIQNWTHHNSFLGTPLVRNECEEKFWCGLLDHLDRGNWPGFLHINGLTIGGKLEETMRSICDSQYRRCDLVAQEARAFLESDLNPEAYYNANVRGKKRKELRRQTSRLKELGDIQFFEREDANGLDEWIDEFLAVERNGWKGRNGSALDCQPDTRAFFRDILKGAAANGQLVRHDLRLDDLPIAMLVNFQSAPGSFSFKTTFDEDYGRFSPGVLLQHKNLNVLKNRDIQWMDSCAAQGHPMIDSLWSGRRYVGRFSIELSGMTRKIMFRGVRLGEGVMAQIRKREAPGGPKEIA